MGTETSQISIYPGMLCIKNTIRQATLQGHPRIDKTRHYFLFQLKNEGYRSSELNKKAKTQPMQISQSILNRQMFSINFMCTALHTCHGRLSGHDPTPKYV